MKNLFLIILFLNTFSHAQNTIPPQGISHRGTVYNTSGDLVTDSEVKIKISILDGSTSGTSVYTEIHTVHTNDKGQYSLNIGTVNPAPTPSFSSINWGHDLKFLKVEIDPTGIGTTFPISGTNQLMSVPYALYALNSQIKVYNNVTELRDATGNLNEIVYIKGHTTAGDGGEGNFIWRELPIGNVHLNHNNGTIIRKDDENFGWVRIIEDKINVKFFGVNFNSDAPDQGVLIQKAIDYACQNAFNYPITSTKKYRDYTNCGSTVYIPAGEYKIMDKLILKYGVNLEGDGTTTTVLKADNSLHPAGTMVEIDNGFITGVTISNITFDGGCNPYVGGFDPTSTSLDDAKNCFYIKARQSEPPAYSMGYTGGLWLSTFKNITIKNFNGNGIILEGSGINSNNSLAPDYAYSYTNQALLFENVYITRQRDRANSLLIRGMAGQLTFIECGFDGLVYEGNIASSTYKTNKGFNVAIETNGVQGPVIKFLTCTFQYSEYGAFTSYAESVTFDNCWFEYLDIGVAANKAAINSNASKCINILNSRFANASGFGSEWNKVQNSNFKTLGYGGQCISVEGGSNVNVQNNYVIVSDPNILNTSSINRANAFIRNYGLDSKINVSNNSFQHPFLGKTFGVANNIISIVDNNLKTIGYKFVSVNTLSPTDTANYIKEIISEISAGETITIKAFGTGQSQIKFDNTRNIVLPKPLLILNANDVATFVKVDSPTTIGGITYDETYHLISISSEGDTGWVNVSSFQNSSNVNVNQPLRVRKKNGEVHLDGNIKSTLAQTNGTTYVLFRLSSEFWPSRRMSFPIIRANTATTSIVGRIDIDDQGWVYGVNCSTISNSLSSISFLTD